MRRQTLTRFVAFLLVAPSCLFVQKASAQRMGGGHFASGAHSFHFNAESNFGRYGNFGSRYGSLAALPLLTDPFYMDALYDSGYPVASQPPIVILQGAPSAASSVPQTASSPHQPLMIELQGDRYVQVSGEDDSGAEMVDKSGALAKHLNSFAAPHPVPELPPAILIFRDGHHEEVSEYTITDGILYASGNFYTGGSWNRKIELSSLNLPDTIQSNQSRGVQFRLPAAPNEVIVRP
jgi:hypothetical protein